MDNYRKQHTILLFTMIFSSLSCALYSIFTHRTTAEQEMRYFFFLITYNLDMYVLFILGLVMKIDIKMKPKLLWYSVEGAATESESLL